VPLVDGARFNGSAVGTKPMFALFCRPSHAQPSSIRNFVMIDLFLILSRRNRYQEIGATCYAARHLPQPTNIKISRGLTFCTSLCCRCTRFTIRQRASCLVRLRLTRAQWKQALASKATKKRHEPWKELEGSTSAPTLQQSPMSWGLCLVFCSD
jgi:hypothetical protein